MKTLIYLALLNIAMILFMVYAYITTGSGMAIATIFLCLLAIPGMIAMYKDIKREGESNDPLHQDNHHKAALQSLERYLHCSK